jgi:hypothetical protein
VASDERRHLDDRVEAHEGGPRDAEEGRPVRVSARATEARCGNRQALRTAIGASRGEERTIRIEVSFRERPLVASRARVEDAAGSAASPSGFRGPVVSGQ